MRKPGGQVSNESEVLLTFVGEFASHLTDTTRYAHSRASGNDGAAKVSAELLQQVSDFPDQLRRQADGTPSEDQCGLPPVTRAFRGLRIASHPIAELEQVDDTLRFR